MPPPGEVTLGEVARRLDALHTDVRDLRSAVVEREDLTVVAAAWQNQLTAHERHADTRFSTVERDVAAVRAWQTWAGRVVLGAIILAALTALLTLPVTPGG